MAIVCRQYWIDLQRASDNLPIMEVNLKVLQNVNSKGLCEGYDNTLQKCIELVNKNKDMLYFDDLRDIHI